MIIIGVDFHPEFQQIASVDTDSGEFQEKRLTHREEAEKIYRALACAGQKVRVGMEASGHARWFERLLAELQIELLIGDAAEIRTKRVRKQKTDRQDAQLILSLLLEDRFPRIWVPSWENRDLRQLLWHRHRMVQARTRIMNQLQAVALNEGLRFLLVEAAQVTARSLPQWRSKYLHLMMRRGRKTAKVAMARRLAVHLYWMMRQGWDYQQWIKFGSHAGQLGNRHGVQQNIEHIAWAS